LELGSTDSSMLVRLFPPPRRVAALTVLLVCFAATVFVAFLAGEPALQPTPVVGSVVVLALLFAASEVMVVHLEARGEAHSLSFSEVPLLIGVVLATPAALVFGRLIGAGLTLALHRHQGPRKLAFNLAAFASETVIAATVFRTLLDGAPPLSGRGWLAALVAVICADAFGALVVTMAITLYSGPPTPTALQRVAVAATVAGLANGALGMATVSAIATEPWFAVPLGAGALLLYLLYRSYIRLSQRYDSLEALHRFTEHVTSSLDLRRVVGAVLSAGRDLMRAESVDLLVLDATETGALLVTDHLGQMSAQHVALDEARRYLDELVPERQAHLLDTRHALPAWLAGTVVKDAAAAPVLLGEQVSGVLVAWNRLTQVSTFGPGDVRLLETLANQAAVALENGRLFDRLRDEAAIRTRQALHDPLTGLPNRRQLEEHLALLLESGRTLGRGGAVLLIDLEGFKEVNDTLGHHTGDIVIRLVAQRMADHLGEGAFLARFGGDEFVVVLSGASEAAAVATAGALLQSLSSPFTVDDMNVAVGARAGIARFPDHATVPAALLRLADVAMYSAKATSDGIAVYAPENDPFTRQRLALAGELRHALERGEIEVHYQPQVAPNSGQVVGAEALARWHHPTRGLLLASEFVPVAERGPAIHGLTLQVLGVALGQCQHWHRTGHDLSVAVNLSAQNLVDPHLPADVLELLVTHGLPPRALVLELTESAAMTESRRSLGVIGQLHDMGVRVAIDDFGTGYSSLSYLRRLPVSEIKIDRSFVGSMLAVAEDDAIVRTTIELGHRLGLGVIAEGVDDLALFERLARYGCDVVQGYAISRPLAAERFGAWLADRAAVEAVPLPPTVPHPPA
jgi:diguanylate cyclase (GGDEF)-like protein